MSTTLNLAPARVDVRVRFGDAVSVTLDFVDADDTAIDVSSWSFTGTVDPESGSSIDLNVAHGVTGRIVLSETAANVSAAAVGGVHWWELRRGDSDETVLAGRWIVETDRASA